MKLLFVHERFGSFAGAEANALATAQGLRARGHTVGILHGPGGGEGEEEWRETFTERFSLVPADGTSGLNAAAVPKAVAAFQPEILYLHKISEKPVLQALASAPVPVVGMVHDHEIYCMRGYRYNPWTRQICRRAASPYCVFPCGGALARNRSGLIPFRWVSYAAKKETRRIYRGFNRTLVASESMKAELLLNGFSPSRVEIHPPVPPASTDIQASFDDRNLIVYAGQITRGKGVDLLLRALALVRVRFECWIVGEGNYRSYCERLARALGLGDRVRFFGFIPSPRLGEFYREASLAVVSSVWPEPFGAVGLEAMRYGLPVVGFDAGAIREWLIDGVNGCLIPWMDRELFAARVEHLLMNKPKARQLGAQARRTAAERHDFSNYISGLEALFQRVIEEPADLPRDPGRAALERTDCL